MDKGEINKEISMRKHIQQRGTIMIKVQSRVMINEKGRIQLEATKTNLGRITKGVHMDGNHNETNYIIKLFILLILLSIDT